jgi:hypothetical protein
MILQHSPKAIELDDSTMQQYEKLRSQSLSRKESFPERSLGLVLFIRQGMLAWLEVCHKCTPAGSKQNMQQQTPALAYQVTSEMIKVMANITLCNLEEAPL